MKTEEMRERVEMFKNKNTELEAKLSIVESDVVKLKEIFIEQTSKSRVCLSSVL